MEFNNLTKNFPEQDYVPFGYIDNPHHSMVLNRSGIIRSVPPIGFGFWARGLSWLYSGAARRDINYLSFLDLSVNVDDKAFHTAEDFEKSASPLVSRYHTKSMMSYDWSFSGLSFSAKYFLADENALMCIFEIANKSDKEKTAIVHATNIYGFPELGWWGCNGVTSSGNNISNTCVSKLWAYGD
ncbi:MAG: hypothetical protein KAS17_03440, partial [Victivallaceae bacterium]|nr:hypothetical protein [Victivallaceae bacterium]